MSNIYDVAQYERRVAALKATLTAYDRTIATTRRMIDDTTKLIANIRRNTTPTYHVRDRVRCIDTSHPHYNEYAEVVFVGVDGDVIHVRYDSDDDEVSRRTVAVIFEGA